MDESNNKIVLYFEDKSTPFPLFIPPGTYEIDEINKVIQKEIKQNIYASDKVFSEIFNLSANNSTLKYELISIIDTDLSHPNCLSTLLVGFQNIKSDEKTGVNIISKYNESKTCVQVRLVCIDCNLDSGAYINGKKMHTLFEFDVDLEPGYKLTKEQHNIIYLSVKPEGRQFLDNFMLKVLDDKGDIVDFRVEQITVKLGLKKLYGNSLWDFSMIIILKSKSFRNGYINKTHSDNTFSRKLSTAKRILSSRDIKFLGSIGLNVRKC